MKYLASLVLLLLTVGCAPYRGCTVYRMDNGEDYMQEGQRRIVDGRGRIGYADENGTVVIEPRFAFGFPFREGRAKVTNRGEEKVVPGSQGEYRYWDSDEWYYIDKGGRVLPQYSVMEMIPERIADDKESGRYMVRFMVLARWFYLPYDRCDDAMMAEITDAMENGRMIEVTLLNRSTIVGVEPCHKARPDGIVMAGRRLR